MLTSLDQGVPERFSRIILLRLAISLRTPAHPDAHHSAWIHTYRTLYIVYTWVYAYAYTTIQCDHSSSCLDASILAKIQGRAH